MKKSILSLALAVLMVMTLFTVGAFAEGDMTAADLQQALNAAKSGETVTMTSDVTVSNDDDTPYTSSVITVPDGVTLDGNGHKIVADSNNWIQKDNGKGNTVNANHIVGVSNGSKVMNLTIVGTGFSKSGIHAYGCTQKVMLENVNIMNCGNAAVQVNGSVVEATELVTSGNVWGAVNVDKGSGVTQQPSFTIVSGDLGENVKIWTELVGEENVISVPKSWATINGEKINSFAPVSDLGDEVVYNVNKQEYYLTLAFAIEKADDGDELVLMGDASVKSAISVSKSLTLDGNNNTITGVADDTTVNFVITAGNFEIKNATVKDFGGNVGTTNAWGLFKVPDTADDSVSFTASGLTVENFNRGAFDINAGTFYITDCEIDCENNSPEGYKLTKALLAGYDAKGTIKDCYIKNASSDYEQWASGGIEVLDDAVVTVDGCNLENVQYGIYPYIYGAEYGLNASVTVKNTTIEANERAICVGTSDNRGKASVTIESGSFAGEVICVGDEGASAEGLNITVRGGTFTSSVAKYVSNDLNYELNNDGVYTYYPTLEEALDAAKPGAVIKDVDAPAGAETYTVVIDPANGGEKIELSFSEGMVIDLPDAPKNSGYIFLGWRCGNATYKAGEAITVNSDMTFTAVWGNLPDVDPEDPEEPEIPDFPFYDVNVRDWYYDAVYYVWEKGLMDGVDTHEFAPNATLTRAMVWTIIARAEGVDTTGGSSWYAKAQEWVVAKGISDGENPSAAITRQELVTMLYRLAGEPTVSGSITAPDAESVSSWASDAMVWAMNIGLIEGDENGAVTPTATATRAQAAAIFMRYIEA